MFILTVRLKGAEAPVVMRWETQEGALAGVARITASPLNQDGKPDLENFGVKITDGFGINAFIKPSEVSACFISDVALDCEAQVRCQLIAQRAQGELQAKLANDPTLALRRSVLSGGRAS